MSGILLAYSRPTLFCRHEESWTQKWMKILPIGADFSLFLWVQVPSLPLALFRVPSLSRNGPFLQHYPGRLSECSYLTQTPTGVKVSLRLRLILFMFGLKCLTSSRELAWFIRENVEVDQRLMIAQLFSVTEKQWRLCVKITVRPVMGVPHPISLFLWVQLHQKAGLIKTRF